MTKELGRNDKCHCGSGEKYKRCCQDEDRFKERLEKDHKRKEKELMEFFNHATREVNTTYSTEEDFTPIRVHAIVVFTWIDVLANYWDQYVRYSDDVDNLGPRDRFTDWTDEFVFTEENKEYNNSEELQGINSDRLYELRSGLVHFMGLGNPQEEGSVILVPHVAPDEQIEKYKSIFEKEGNSAIFLSPNQIHDAVREGGTLMLNRIVDVIGEANKGDDASKWDHIRGIDSLYEKYEREGAVMDYFEVN